MPIRLPKVTRLKDVARMAGVSTATVSRVRTLVERRIDGLVLCPAAGSHASLARAIWSIACPW